jgi:ABC-type glutathione transport system ATPase component/ABC-type dipeptide/oligopeptide/nickel transport system permease subunit
VTVHGRGRLLGRVGISLFVLIALAAIAGPALVPYDPQATVAQPFAPPSLAHPLGANDIGQDLLSQLVAGGRISLFAGLVAGITATIIGVLAGILAGLGGRVADAVIMRTVDVMLALPLLPLAIVLSAFMGPRLEILILIITAVMWPRTARILRSQVLALRERGHVQAARVMGAGNLHLLRWHLLPMVFPLVVPELTRAAGAAIILETSLSFLGLGDPTASSWGTVLFYANTRSAFLTEAWVWWIVPPGLAIGLTVLSFGLIGYAVEERARPRLKGGWTTEAGRKPVPADRAQYEPHDRVSELMRVEDLSIVYETPEGVVKALDGASLTIEAGEVVGMIGESGSGKTTMAGSLVRLVRRPARTLSGRILFRGRDITKAGHEELRRLRGREIGFIPQNSMNALNPVRPVLEQVAEAIEAHAERSGGSRLARRNTRARAAVLLGQVGIPSDRFGAYPHELSGGMRQRVVIAIAVASSPRLLVADEPTSGLDVLTQVEIMELLRAVRRGSNPAMLIVSHDVGAVRSLADRLVVMHRGRVGPENGHSLPGGRRVESGASLPAGLISAPLKHDAGVGRVLGGIGHGTVLSFDGVDRIFRTGRRTAVEALSGVSFMVRPGEWVGLVGPSGAGKSTIARLAAGLDRPTTGRVVVGRVSGSLRRADRRELARHVHLVLQDPYDALPPAMRVGAIVGEPLRIQGLPVQREKIDAALEEVALSPASSYIDRFPHELSGGERQRVALARSLVLDARLIVADEPTSLMDASLRLELLGLMRRMTEARGTSCLYITHDLALAAPVCDRLLVIDRGRIVEEGPTALVLGSPRHATTAALVNAARMLAQ